MSSHTGVAKLMFPVHVWAVEHWGDRTSVLCCSASGKTSNTERSAEPSSSRAQTQPGQAGRGGLDEVPRVQENVLKGGIWRHSRI